MAGNFDRNLRLPRIHFRRKGSKAEKSDGVGWFEPTNLGTKGQHPTSRPPKPLYPSVHMHLHVSLTINQHGCFADPYLGPRSIILGTVPLFAIRLHIMVLNATHGNFSVVFFFSVFDCKSYEIKGVINVILREKWQYAAQLGNERINTFI